MCGGREVAKLRDAVQNRLPTRIALAALISVCLGGAALGPAAASAIEVSAPQVETGVLFVRADESVVNQVGVSWVTSPRGAPDLVIGDTRAGIPDPIPSQCARVDPTIVRCPAFTFTRLDANLGRGADSISVVPAVGIDGFITMKLELGLGNDVASDRGETKDVWNGGKGRDRLVSGPGDDLVRGGAQNDVIDCGAGKHDVGIGGPGKLDLGRH
jgi:RTX calcium-binding nonapeptide repeat (4 copies)